MLILLSDLNYNWPNTALGRGRLNRADCSQPCRVMELTGCSVCALIADRSFSSGVNGKWSRNMKYFSYLYSCTLARPHFEHVLRMTPKFPKRWRWAFHCVDKKIHTIYNLESYIQTLMNHADKYRLLNIPSCSLQISPVHYRNEPLSRLITSHRGLPLIQAFKAPEMLLLCI